MQKMARLHPALQPLANLMKRIGDFRQFGLTIGSDDPARYPVMPFKSDHREGNQPKSSRFIFAQSSWTQDWLSRDQGILWLMLTGAQPSSQLPERCQKTLP